MPGTRLIAGAMSGTSADGVDVAIVRITGRGLAMQAETLLHRAFAYDRSLRDAIFVMRKAGAISLADLAALAREISLAYATAINAALAAAGLNASDLAAVAAHGQTLFHSPPNTIQWLDPSLIAARVGCPVVSDFRRADCAAGGQGAPLVPFADYLLFRHETRHRVLLNLGGIANLTLLPAMNGDAPIVETQRPSDPSTPSPKASRAVDPASPTAKTTRASDPPASSTKSSRASDTAAPSAKTPRDSAAGAPGTETPRPSDPTSPSDETSSAADPAASSGKASRESDPSSSGGKTRDASDAAVPPIEPAAPSSAGHETSPHLIAFDTGPANCISDWLMRELFPEGPGVDESGHMASLGQADEALATRVLAADFFRQPPPKSTDGPAMIDLFFDAAGDLGGRARLPALLATACLVTAASISRAIRDFLPHFPDELIVSGGGVHNRVMMACLADQLHGVPIVTTDRVGVPSAAKEAIAFALLAAATLDGEPSNVPSVTGAVRAVVLGSITPWSKPE